MSVALARTNYIPAFVMGVVMCFVFFAMSVGTASAYTTSDTSSRFSEETRSRLIDVIKQMRERIAENQELQEDFGDNVREVTEEERREAIVKRIESIRELIKERKAAAEAVRDENPGIFSSTEGSLRDKIAAVKALIEAKLVEQSGDDADEGDEDDNDDDASGGDSSDDGDVKCTMVIGFSQSRQWFNGLSDTDGTWQLLWQSGAAIERWISPSFSGWNESIQSRCSENSSEPDAIVFTISGAARSADEWASDIDDAVEVALDKYPSVDKVYLQPVIGGPDGGNCSKGGDLVRAYSNYPTIVDGIAQASLSDRVKIGGAFQLSSCSGYSDSLGHLTSSGSGQIGSAAKQYYENL